MHNNLTMSNLVSSYYAKTLVIYALVTLTLTTLSLKSYALTLEDLIANNQLTIETSIKQNEQQIVGQPLIITIEIASQRWFSKGTKVKAFELTDTIILANSEISINGTKRVSGETWSTQTREITIYPRRAGHFVLPEIEVGISVNTEHNGIVEGIITTEKQDFVVSLPEELVGIDNFIVSPKIELKVTSDFNDKQNYALGDAVSVEVVISSQNSPAMMIPPLTHPDIKGLSIYQKTPQVFDKSNRGELIGTRIESFTYIFEHSGEYQIPEQSIYWWNTQTNELETLVINQLTLTAGTNSPAINNTSQTGFSLSINALKYALAIIISLGFISLLYRYRNHLIAFYANITHLERRKAKSAFIKAISAEQYITAVNHLHKYTLIVDAKPEQLQSTLAIKLRKLAFEHNCQLSPLSKADAKELLATLKPVKAKVKNTLDFNNTIKINNEV